jgi:FtsP/CotA-like multicopper oxidase with cupredoxin domain
MNHIRDEKTTSIAIIAIVVALASLGVAMLTGGVGTIPLQQVAVAQQQNETTTTTQSIMPASSNKTFYIFSEEVEGLNETAAGVAGDIYSLPVIEVNKGDSVTVHFYNTEEKEEGAPEERHSFTIDAQPYSVNIDIGPSESGNATFTADQEGIFPYYCIYHLPTMTGELVVLPPPSSPATASSQPAT